MDGIRESHYDYNVSWWQDIDAPSQDESDILNYLSHSNLVGLDILHMGIGNNFVIEKFPTSRVTGVTVSILEYQKALSLKIPNYFPILMDKHDPALLSVLGSYDVIIDNNIGSYSVDYESGLKVLDVLLKCLRPGGFLFTHIEGLAYRVPFDIEQAMNDLNTDRTIHYHMDRVVVIK